MLKGKKKLINRLISTKNVANYGVVFQRQHLEKVSKILRVFPFPPFQTTHPTCLLSNLAGKGTP